MPASVRQTVIAKARHLIVKVGTNAICDDAGRPDLAVIRSLARQIAAVMDSGVGVSLVTSGAIGAGLAELDLARRPKTLPMLQAVAAVGQGQLMRTFHDVFARRGRKVAQVLVTREDFEDRTRYLNIRNTLSKLSELGVLAIVNENDAVAVDEIRYGDNDIIAAHLTNMLAADVLVLLTTVDGVMDGGAVVDVVEKIDEKTMKLVTGRRSRLGSGGMATKLTAAAMVTRAGEAIVIANARQPKVLTLLLAGQRVGTVFVPGTRKMSRRDRWIAQASRSAGTITVDAGAARALQQRGKSLLPSGITAVHGRFPKGAIVAVTDQNGRTIARGLTNYSAEQIAKIRGLKTSQIPAALGDKPYDEVIHRNNMTVA
ncbi:MAG: glutamate 5-kinase [Planctomycetota bacterium]|jgi:glutamate 5-kinase